MRDTTTRLFVLLILAAVFATATVAPAQQFTDSGPIAGCCEPDWCCNYPGWYASGDAVFMHRSRSRDSILVVADRGTIIDISDDTPLLDSRDLKFNDFETGYRMELGRSLGGGLVLEGGFMKISEWDSAAQITTNGLISPNAIAEGLSPPLAFNRAFYNADTFYEAIQQSVVYRSELTSAELNLKAFWKHCNIIRSEFIGVRYIQLLEQFELTSQDEVNSTSLNGIGTYTVDTDNDLVGVHYGQDFGIPLFGCALLTTRLRAGVFGNNIEQNTRIVDSSVLRFDARDRGEELSFIGEINVGLNVRINHLLSVRGGYNFMWMEGLALAAEQGYPVAFTGVSPLNDNGGIFYHGFSVGAQISR